MANSHSGRVTIDGIMTPDQFEHFKREILQKIDDIADKIDNDEDEFLTTEGACEYLKIGKTKLYNLVTEGIIKKYRITGTVLYRKDELRKAVLDDSI
ncbi:helix-turn-helix domain-containing protein [Aliifodinibius salicampi]|uniref:Helix-turn-helix domain-containing protein n=1 Tax=Fodinibius salicampi TaxID=1920655 RepID=A0ABT3PXV1_9BACT|nr:helix-turn-helix domain-containing protein [Fodinibius salicampi]MCW9712690.1 helix-turn-helix domain-containing protein [Fodinibius salicampi]